MESRARTVESKITRIVVFLAVVGLVFVGYNVLFAERQGIVAVSVSGKTFNAKVAQTDSERKQGLSDTPKLAENEGLLMVYDRDDKWRIWMKDMNYPIDIIWINKDKTVVHVVRDADPSSYPTRYFTSGSDARYVLEVAAGSAAKYGIVNNKKVNFNDSEFN